MSTGEGYFDRDTEPEHSAPDNDLMTFFGEVLGRLEPTLNTHLYTQTLQSKLQYNHSIQPHIANTMIYVLKKFIPCQWVEIYLLDPIQRKLSLCSLLDKKGTPKVIQKQNLLDITYDSLPGHTFLKKQAFYISNCMSSELLNSFKHETLFYNSKKNKYEKAMTMLSCPLCDHMKNVYGVAVFFNKINAATNTVGLFQESDVQKLDQVSAPFKKFFQFFLNTSNQILELRMESGSQSEVSDSYFRLLRDNLRLKIINNISERIERESGVAFENLFLSMKALGTTSCQVNKVDYGINQLVNIIQIPSAKYVPSTATTGERKESQHLSTYLTYMRDVTKEDVIGQIVFSSNKMARGSSFRFDLVKRLSSSISQVAHQLQEPNISQLFESPDDSINIMINVNECFLQENSECKDYISRSEQFIKTMTGSETVRIFFHNVTDDNVVFIQNDSIHTFGFNASSQLGETISTLQITTNNENKACMQVCFPMISTFGNVIGAVLCTKRKEDCPSGNFLFSNVISEETVQKHIRKIGVTLELMLLSLHTTIPDDGTKSIQSTVPNPPIQTLEEDIDQDLDEGISVMSVSLDSFSGRKSVQPESTPRDPLSQHQGRDKISTSPSQLRGAKKERQSAISKFSKSQINPSVAIVKQEPRHQQFLDFFKKAISIDRCTFYATGGATDSVIKIMQCGGTGGDKVQGEKYEIDVIDGGDPMNVIATLIANDEEEQQWSWQTDKMHQYKEQGDKAVYNYLRQKHIQNHFTHIAAIATSSRNLKILVLLKANSDITPEQLHMALSITDNFLTDPDFIIEIEQLLRVAIKQNEVESEEPINVVEPPYTSGQRKNAKNVPSKGFVRTEKRSLIGAGSALISGAGVETIPEHTEEHHPEIPEGEFQLEEMKIEVVEDDDGQQSQKPFIQSIEEMPSLEIAHRILDGEDTPSVGLAKKHYSEEKAQNIKYNQLLVFLGEIIYGNNFLINKMILIKKIFKSIYYQPSLGKMLLYLSSLIKELLNTAHCVFYLNSDSGSESEIQSTDSLVFRSVFDPKNSKGRQIVLDLNLPHYKTLLQMKEAKIIQNDSTLLELLSQEREQGDLTNMIICPIVNKQNGTIIGILELWNKKELLFKKENDVCRKFSPANLHFVRQVQSLLSDTFQDIQDKIKETKEALGGIPQNDEEIYSMLEAQTNFKKEPVHELIKVLSKEYDFDFYLKKIRTLAQTLIGADRATIFLLDGTKLKLQCQSLANDLPDNITIELGDGIVGEVAKSGKTLNIDNAQDHPLFMNKVDQVTGFTTRNVLCVPLKNLNGNVIGCFEVVNKHHSEESFSFNDQLILETFSDIASILIETIGKFKSTLEESLHLLGILESVNNLVIILDKQGRVHTTNKSLKRTLGVDEAESESSSYLQWLHPAENDQIIQDIQFVSNYHNQTIEKKFQRLKIPSPNIDPEHTPTTTPKQYRELIVHYTIHQYIDLLSNEHFGVVLIIEDCNLSNAKLIQEDDLLTPGNNALNHMSLSGDHRRDSMRRKRRKQHYTVSHDFDFEGLSFETNLQSVIGKLERILISAQEGKKVDQLSILSILDILKNKDLGKVSREIGEDSTSGGSTHSHIRSLVLYANEMYDQISGNLVHNPNLNVEHLTRLLNIHTGIVMCSLTVRDLDEGEVDWQDLRDFSFDFSQVTDIKQQIILAYKMFADFNLFNEFNIDKQKFLNLMRKLFILYSYRKNPFHNFTHALAVLHWTYCMLTSLNFASMLAPLDILSLLIAAIGHDVDHTGATNAFEIASSSKLALRYHDQAVLEQHHTATLFYLLQNVDCNVLDTLSTDEKKLARKLIIHSILYTDMSKHFQLIGDVNLRMDQYSAEDKETHLMAKDGDRELVLAMILHCADLSNPCRVFDQASYWAVRISKEFTNQINKEEELGLPVTQFMLGLEKIKTIYKQEQGFINFVVKPLWVAMDRFSDGGAKWMVENLESNLEKYKAEVERMEVQEKQEEESKQLKQRQTERDQNK